MKGRQALQACHAAKPLASEQYLASLTLSVRFDRILSTCRVQLTKFRELASDASSYAAVSQRCTVEELGALNRLLALTSSKLSKSSDPAAGLTKPAELDHLQALVPFQAAIPEPALSAEVVLPPATSSDTATLQPQPASCSFRRLVTFDQLFGCDRAETGRLCSWPSRWTRLTRQPSVHSRSNAVAKVRQLQPKQLQARRPSRPARSRVPSPSLSP